MGDSLGTLINYNQESIKITNVLLIHNVDVQHLQQITERKKGRKERKEKNPQNPQIQKLTFT